LDELPIKIAGLFILLVLSACFSIAETLLNRLRKDEVRETVEKGGKNADLITSVLQQPKKYSVTIIVAKSCLIVITVFLTLSFFNIESIQSKIISAVLAILLIIIFTEIIPKNYIEGLNQSSAIFAIKFIRVAYFVLFLIIKPLMFISRIGVRILGGRVMEEENSLVSPEVLKVLVDVGDSDDILEEQEREMIHRIFEFPDKVAREIMIPRTDMVCLEVDSDKDEIFNTVIESRHTRIPIYEKTVDNITGILHVKELIDCLYENKPINLREIIKGRPAFFRPESKNINELFQDLRRNHQHMAIIVDEYGGTSGVLTLEDIVEEIVGEIQDEYDTEQEWLQIDTPELCYSVDASVPLHEVNEKMGTEIISDSVDSIGGFVMDYLGEVPKPGTTFIHQQLEFHVEDSDEKRIRRIRIKKIQIEKESYEEE